MKKTFGLILSVAMLSLALASCGGNAADPTPPSSDPTPSPAPSEQLPDPAAVVAAIENADKKTEQNYDFTLVLSADIGAEQLGFANVDAIYTCNYRYNRDTGELSFKRTTSGDLLYDSTEYIYSSGDSRVTVKMNGENEVKKAAVSSKDDELHLLNIPFSKLVSSLEENEISNIAKAENGGYSAKIKFSPDNAVLSEIFGLIGKMDTIINLKGVKFTNPVSGLDFGFSVSDDILTAYSIEASLSIPIKGAKVQFTLSYEQKANGSAIVIPSIDELITDKTEIGNELETINSALGSVKNETAYSLDLEAVNEMDPGWTVTATRDTYSSRLYKNTAEDGSIHFNNSYEYHTHHEEDGKESYKFTYGNIEDGTTYKISRKGSNTSEQVTDVTADTRFEFMTKLFRLTASEADCIRKVTEGEKTTYTVYLGDNAVIGRSEGIIGILNGEPIEGVVAVENYFNEEEYTIKDAALTVVMESDKISSMELDTEIKYNPTDGEYTDRNVTLNNMLTLKINEELEKAKDYKAPSKADGIFENLEYIL